MKKIIVIIMLLFPVIVKANCSNKELTRYKTLAGNISTYYDYNESNNTFIATIENVHNELFIKDTTTNKEYRKDDNIINEIQINNLQPGKTTIIKVYPKKNECSAYTLTTLYITTPYYNKYYNDPICNNNSSNLCSKWTNTTAISYEQFVQTVQEGTEEKVEQEKEREEETKEYGFLEFLADYYIYILLTIIVTGSIAIYRLDKKSKFDF